MLDIGVSGIFLQIFVFKKTPNSFELGVFIYLILRPFGIPLTANIINCKRTKL